MNVDEFDDTTLHSTLSNESAMLLAHVSTVTQNRPPEHFLGVGGGLCFFTLTGGSSVGRHLQLDH